MPRGDNTKKPAFELWVKGKSLCEIQKAVCQEDGTKPESVKGWVTDWERGKQKTWTPKLS